MKKFLFLVFAFLIFPHFVFATEKIEINTASLEQLETLTGIGPAKAQAIIDARPFSSVDDLIRVKGIGGKTLQKIKDQGLAYVGEKSEIQNPKSETNSNSLNSNIQNTPPEIIYPSGVFINEILPSPEGPDEENEWIELYNQNNFEVDLSDWKIEDVEGTKTTYIFNKNTKIATNGFLVLKRPDTKITLNNSEDGLNLLWPDDKIIDSLSYIKAPTNQSYNKTSSGFSWSLSLTPGAKNMITEAETKSDKQDLSKTEKSVNSNIAGAELAALSYNTNQEKDLPGQAGKSSNPWFLFFTAIIITIISAILVLFIKFKLK